MEGALRPFAPEPDHIGFLQPKDFNRRHGTPTDIKTTFVQIICKEFKFWDWVEGYVRHPRANHPRLASTWFRACTFTLSTQTSAIIALPSTLSRHCSSRPQ